MNSKRRRGGVKRVYELLYGEYGPQNWWPGDTAVEVCIGAILTQSTSWTNVEKAIGNLKERGLVDVRRISTTDESKLAELIRPSLYYNVKARKLKEFARFVEVEYGGQVDDMLDADTEDLREKLLGVWGIGPETSDSILLYALGKPSFVVDAYTRRIFTRMGLLEGGESYEEIKLLFESALEEDPRLYNEYHALIVEHGKTTCKTRPECETCCLEMLCDYKG
ncbi:MAG: endonuclease [Candidatus Altiarchaeales archaeon]|nr:endonuclease [Candidatus Altiarchaeales archaeon]MBD3417152.1 endonuclease [Candidatus Altiarchaeales archaeon]